MNVLGRYTIFEQLGAGAMGTVHRANDSVLERDVALKTIRTNSSVDPEVRERFYREAKACARLQHPHIVSVFDVGEIDSIAYIAMELLRGHDFRSLIENKVRLTMPEKIEAMIQVCEALDHAHRHGVIHRDIKPSNLFRQEDGRVKIVDFGIARLPSSRATLQTTIMGTPNYMSPEHILGKPTDARSDLFSAGLVFFELLTHAHPFQSKGIPTRIVEGDPDSLFDHDSTIPVPLETIITTRALAKDPEHRYASGAEMADQLRAVRDRLMANASPYMTKVHLPSPRPSLQSRAAVPADPGNAIEAPSGDDTAEWRLTEVLRLSFDLDEALEAKDQAAASSALKQLRAIAASDSRFVAAAEDYLQSYESMWGPYTREVAPVTVPPSAVDTRSGSDTDPQVKTDGRSISSPAPASPDPATAEPSTQAATAQLPKPGETVSNRPTVLQKARQAVEELLKRLSLSPFSSDQKKLVVGAITACALLIFLAAVFNRIASTSHAESAVGIVRVVSPRAAVRDKPDAGGTVLAEVTSQSVVHLLELPSDRSDVWLRVQAFTAGGKAMEPGYIAVADVANWPDWSMNSLESAVRITSMMCPGTSAQSSDAQMCLEKWRSLEARAAGKPEEAAVRSAIARLQPPPPPAAPVTADPNAPATTNPQPTSGAPPVPATPGTQEPLTPDQLVARGRRALSGANPNSRRARYFAQEALKLDSAHAGARTLLQEISEFDETFAPSKN